MQLTNSREAAGFFLARAIVVGALFVATPTVLRPLYIQLMRTGGGLWVTAAGFGVALAGWLITLGLFLVLRGGLGGVPAVVAGPDRRSVTTSSGAEIGAYVIAVLIVTVFVSILNAFVMTGIYVSLRQSGRMDLVLPISLATAAAISVVFFLILIALRAVMAAVADGPIEQRVTPSVQAGHSVTGPHQPGR